MSSLHLCLFLVALNALSFPCRCEEGTFSLCFVFGIEWECCHCLLASHLPSALHYCAESIFVFHRHVLCCRSLFFSSRVSRSVLLFFFRNFMPRGYGYQSIWNFFVTKKTDDFQKNINLGISKAGCRISCWEDTNWPCAISTKLCYI